MRQAGNCVVQKMMVATKKVSFSRRVVDHVTDELVNVLSSGETFEFKPLFSKVFEGLKLKNAVSGGEEMLRLRSYEKLIKLASCGLVEKVGKTYRALEGLEQASSAHRLARLDAAVNAAQIAQAVKS